MAAISVTKIKINSETDPRIETYIFTAEKKFSSYTNIKTFLSNIPFIISNGMLRAGESIQSTTTKNLVYDTLLNADSTHTGLNSIVLLKRAVNYSVESAEKEISFPVNFNLISGNPITTDFNGVLGIYLQALNGVIMSDYNIKTMSIIYKGEE